jgi:hypothetical protein
MEDDGKKAAWTLPHPVDTKISVKYNTGTVPVNAPGKTIRTRTEIT